MSSSSSLPTLLFVVGPPAVGKMTIGGAVAERTGLRLLHNHHTIDLALRFFEFGTPPFHRLVEVFRRRICEEVAASDLPGLVFTFVWAFDDPRDAAALERYAKPFRDRGGRVLFAELEATQQERLCRNETPLRLAEKPFMRDVARSRARLLEHDTQYRLASGGEHDARLDYFRFDTTSLTPEESAEKIVSRFALAR